MNNILIETSMLKLMLKGKSICLCLNSPSYKVGDVLGVKETYRIENGKYFYACEENVKHGDYEIQNNPWCYANSLPSNKIKRHVKITDLTIVSKDIFEELYKKYTVLYNKRMWIVSNDGNNNFETIYNTRTNNVNYNDKIYIYKLILDY